MKEEGFSVLEVSGEGCAGCVSLLPVLKKITQKLGLPLRMLEANEANAAEVRRLNIERVPTVLVLKDGEEIARCAGYQPEEILEVWLEAKAKRYPL